MAQRSFVKRFGYFFLKSICQLIGVVCFNIRCYGLEHVPASGPVLVCVNHQSLLDPIIVGLCLPRRLNFLGRKTLFRFPPFRWLITFLDAIPLDREGLGVAGLKECLRRIKQGEMVLMFPEGTRTYDGRIGSFQSGFVMLARRGNVSLLPVAIDGAFEVWPRTAKLPRLGPLRVTIGPPLTPSDIAVLNDRDLVQELESRVRRCHASRHPTA